jgi:hypothetical protein
VNFIQNLQSLKVESVGGKKSDQYFRLDYWFYDCEGTVNWSVWDHINLTNCQYISLNKYHHKKLLLYHCLLDSGIQKTTYLHNQINMISHRSINWTLTGIKSIVKSEILITPLLSTLSDCKFWTKFTSPPWYLSLLQPNAVLVADEAVHTLCLMLLTMHCNPVSAPSAILS